MERPVAAAGSVGKFIKASQTVSDVVLQWFERFEGTVGRENALCYALSRA